jgi:DNA-binding SARP family transcriptional activator
LTDPTRIDVCGHLAITQHGRPLNEGSVRLQGRMLLAFLALHRERPVSREELFLAIWGAETGEDHRAALNSLLSKARRALGADAVPNRGPRSVQLSPDIAVDYHEAFEHLETAREALRQAAPDEVETAARQALELADRGVLQGETAEWLEQPRRRLDEAASSARECLAEAALLAGGPQVQVAVDRARELVAAEPYRESAHALLMRALDAQGNSAEALSVFEALRQRLREMGATPNPTLRALHQRLLNAPAPERAHGAAHAPHVSLQPPAAARSQTGFVGRDAERRLLRAAFDRAQGGSCQLVLLEGEAGIGKTRLALTFASELEQQGGASLYGRCDSDAAIPYQPFVEALRRHLTVDAVGPLRQAIPAHVEELALVLPELQQAGLGAPTRRGPVETERLRLFDAVSMVLCAISQDRPALLILDDLHWADTPTLLMLRQVTRLARSASLLLIGTFRSDERGEQLRDMIADLRREQFFDSIALRGLDEADAERLISQLDAAPPARAVTHALWEESKGNPFFLEEILRHRTHAEPAPDGAPDPTASVPDAVKDVIRRRLARLSPDVQGVLEIAAVIGSEFSAEVLEAVCDEVSENALYRSLDEAVEAHLVQEGTVTYGRFEFEHALTRQTLLDELTRTRLARLHLRVGEELEALGHCEEGSKLADLAHHFREAPPAQGHAKALDYGGRAARHALEVFAYEEAVRQCELALSILRPGEDGEREALLILLGDIRMRAGETASARATFVQAAGIARSRGSAAGLALAALGACGPHIVSGRADPELVRLLEEALELLGDQDETLRSRLLARLAIELSFSAGHVAEREAYSSEAVALARSVSDANALSAALHARHWSDWQPDNLSERLMIATELLQLARATGDRRIEMEGHRWRMMDLLEMGQIEDVDEELHAYAQLAAERRRPAELWYVHLYTAMRFLLAGRYEEAREESQAAFDFGSKIDDMNAHGFTLVMAVMARDLGWLDKVERLVGDNVRRYETIPGWQTLWALILLESGNEDAARETFEHVAADDFSSIPRDGSWLGAMTYSSEVAVGLGDTARAQQLYDRLRPFADRNVVIGFAVACLGSTSRPLALLAASLGRHDDAVRHFEAAISMNERMGARPFLARTQLEYGELLVGGTPDERAAGIELLRQGLATAEELGLRAVRDRARHLLQVTEPERVSV